MDEAIQRQLLYLQRFAIFFVDIDECESSPCQNGAPCTTPSVDFYMCACLDGYSGINCEISRLDVQTRRISNSRNVKISRLTATLSVSQVEFTHSSLHVLELLRPVE